MGFLDSVLGGVLGAEATSLVGGIIAQHGGLSGLAAQFEQQDLGHLVQSWIGAGKNLPISAEQLQQVLGSGVVAQLAAKTGVNPQELLQKISQMLPHTVDQMTPGGVIPNS